jgi:large subunit ribosomal protein L23
MAILNIFKKNSINEKAGLASPKSRIERGTKAGKSDASLKTRNAFIASNVLRTPHITEKAAIMEDGNKYIFKVSDRSNKSEIKKAVEGFYKVDVLSVKIINISGRNVIVGRREGWKKGYKKAIVKIKEGQKIEIMPR